MSFRRWSIPILEKQKQMAQKYSPWVTVGKNTSQYHDRNLLIASKAPTSTPKLLLAKQVERVLGWEATGSSHRI